MSKLYVFVLLTGFLMTIQFSAFSIGKEAEVFENVAYAKVSPTQVMDIYLPEGEGPFPLVVLIHGGAFKMGDKRMETRNAEALVAKGYAAASVNYRLSGEAKFPAQIEDCKAAVRFLRANAKKYRLNPEKIGSWGASAGGNLSALLGTSSGVAELEGASLGNAGVSSKVIASVDWFGPINFCTMDAEAAALGFTGRTNGESSPESLLIGKAVQSAPELVAKANPTTYISADDAAFFIQVGSMDRNIPYSQSRNFYEALKPVIGASKVSFELLEGAGHGGPQFSDSSNLAKVIAFFDKHLK
ncbi:MAG: alpha/beta hydrolase [Prolixibacteraceae bacterium]|nr:alpha/beta hydrolase [Prolixibacteraceae bacterium]